MKDEDYELAIKIVIVGNGIVGKSSMIQRFCKGIFSNEYKKTLGVDFLERMIRVGSENMRLMLWDTAGQEEFDALTKAYYRGAQACVIVFSTTDRESFMSVERWKKKINYECGEIPIALVQNKIDLINESAIRREEVDNLAKRYKWKHFNTSVKDNINVDRVFHFLAESYIELLNDDYPEEPVVSPHPSLYRHSNVSNINSAITTIPAVTPHPLFNQIGSKFLKPKQKPDKIGFQYWNHGIALNPGLPTQYTSNNNNNNNGAVNHFRYKSQFGIIPTRGEHQYNNHYSRAAISLHHHHRHQHQSQQPYHHYLLHKHALQHDYHYTSPYSSDKLFKTSLFKTCRIF